MAFTPVTVSGTFLVTDDLTPARGEITFRLSQSMQDTAANQIVSADRRSVRLDATGSFSIVLPATDDTTTQPTGVTYEVEELIEDQAPRRYAIALPKATTNVNLADIAPAVPGPAMFQYSLVGHTHAPGGGIALDDLSDVTISAPIDGEVVTYDSGTSQFRNEAPAAASHPNLATHDALGLATDAELAAHAAAADPHPGYETTAEGAARITTHEGAANPHPTYHTAAEVATDIATHAAAGDPHPTYATDSDLSGHAAAADPHVGYQKESEKGVALGYASLDAGATVPDAQIPAAIARDAEVTSAVSAHAAAGDPHPTYHTAAEVATDIATHAGAADPHTGYQKESEKGAANGYASLDATTKVPVAELGTGTPDGTKFLRDDRVFATPPGGAHPDLATHDGLGLATDAELAAHAAAGDPHPGYLKEADYDANTILKADSDNTPIPLTMGASTVAARLAAGGIVAATPAEIRTLLDVPTNGEAVLDTLYDANTILKADSDNTPTALTMGASTILARLAAGSIVAATPAQLRTLLSLVVGTDVQAFDADLAAIAALASAADQLPYATAAQTWALTTLTNFARTLLDDTDGSTARGTLGLGTIATQAASSVSITGGSVTGITDVAIADGGTGSSTAQAARIALAIQLPITFSSAGTQTVHAGVSRWLATRAYTIQGARAAINTAPTGASLIVDVNKNGTTVFSTQGNRPTIAISANASGAVVAPDVTTLAADDYLTVDIDQIGSTIAGADLTVTILLLEA